VVDGDVASLRDDVTLLEALREDLGITSLKDGCSPQGQCGCCTVLVDGVARVACVTPVRRVAGRAVTTLTGIDEALLERLLLAIEATGASQCGFCTPGIVARLAGLARRGVPDERAVRTALGAHLCRCTGFQPLVEAALLALDPAADLPAPRDPALAAARASLESGVPQAAGVEIARGEAGFSADVAPRGALVALGVADGGYVVAPSASAARRASGKVQGRNSTMPLRWPVEVPAIDGGVLALATTFVEPAYVEPDASVCEPGGEPSSPAANAGAFGAKRHSPVAGDARRLADEHGATVLALWPREEVVRRGAKRPPIAVALRADGTGVVRVGTTPGSEDLAPVLAAVADVAPGLDVELVAVAGPRVGATHRGAVVAEVLAALAALDAVAGAPIEVTAPSGATARVAMRADGSIDVHVNAGAPLCEVTLRSYVLGAVHQGLGMVRSEGIAVDEAGVVHDLTIRSFGIIGAQGMPHVDVTIAATDEPAVPCGVAVLAATMAAAWVAAGKPPRWPSSVPR
jgi:aerobic-type carbon monoxide dehydrogenase small subunit (CoxS/CutS family)